jgi:hypothetical protein
MASPRGEREADAPSLEITIKPSHLKVFLTSSRNIKRDHMAIIGGKKQFEHSIVRHATLW